MKTIAILALAALMEAGGDALMRLGVKGGHAWGWALGGLLLAAYGLVVNLPDWDFSRLMGVYVCLFFLVTQAIAILAFKEQLSGLAWLGGGLILAGGGVLAMAKVH